MDAFQPDEGAVWLDASATARLKSLLRRSLLSHERATKSARIQTAAAIGLAAATTPAAVHCTAHVGCFHAAAAALTTGAPFLSFSLCGDTANASAGLHAAARSAAEEKLAPMDSRGLRLPHPHCPGGSDRRLFRLSRETEGNRV